MIKIMNAKEVSRDEIFSRVVPTVNVEQIVADIIDNVRKTATARFLNIVKRSIRSSFPRLR